MNDNYQRELYRNQQALLLAFIVERIKSRIFDWAFDLYSIFYALFPEKYHLALIEIFKTIEENAISNPEFEHNVIGFTLEKSIFISEPNDLIHKTFTDLINQNNLPPAIRLYKCLSTIDFNGKYKDEKEKFATNIRNTILNKVFTKFNGAYDNQKWEEVINLGREMEALDYSEEVHPIKKKVAKAIIKLKQEGTTYSLEIDGVKRIIRVTSKIITEKIHDYKRLLFRRKEKILLDYVVDIEPAYGFDDKYIENPKYEDDNIIVELRRGMYEDEFIIKPKT